MTADVFDRSRAPVKDGSANPAERLVTDAEVLQEILHRYAAINRREAMDPAIQVTLDVVEEVFPVEKADVLRASEIAQSRRAPSARGALHIAIMERRGVRAIVGRRGPL